MDTNMSAQVWAEPDYHQPEGHIPPQHHKPTSFKDEQVWKEQINQHWINGWLTYEAKQMCLQEGWCLWCLETDHHVRDCPATREQRCASCQKIGHYAKSCPFINNATSTKWFKGAGWPGLAQGLSHTAVQKDMGALPRSNFLKDQCFNCQHIRHHIKDCPTWKILVPNFDQEEQVTCTVASILQKIKAMTLDDWVELIKALFSQENNTEIIATNAVDGSVASTKWNMETLKQEDWETTETPARIQTMQVQPSWRQTKLGKTTQPWGPAIHLGTMQLGKAAKSLGNPHIPAHIKVLASHHPEGLEQWVLKGYLQLAQRIQNQQGITAVWAIQTGRASTQTIKTQNHPISQKEWQWW